MDDFSFLSFGNDSSLSAPKSHEHRSNTDEFLDQSAEVAIEAWRSFEHSVKQPVLAMAEISDHVLHSHLSSAEWLSTPPPVEAEFGSTKYWAQQTGATLGTVPWFSLLHKVVGAGMHQAVGPGLFETLSTRQLHQYAIAESMITGFTYGAFLKPSRCAENRCLSNFLKERLLVGTTTSATFGVSALTSARISDAIGRPATSLEKIGTSLAASSVAGGFDAEVQALRKHGRLATGEEFAKGVYTYAVIGAGMTAVHEAFPSTRSESLRQRDLSYIPEEQGARAVFQKMPQTIKEAAQQGLSNAIVFDSTGSLLSRSRVPLETSAQNGAFRIVFDRLQQAGLRPLIEETRSGHQISVPLTEITTGRNFIIRQAQKAVEEGMAQRAKDLPGQPAKPAR